MFIQINYENGNEIIINTNEIVFLLKNNIGNVIQFTNGREISFNDKDYQTFLLKLKQSYIEII